MAVSGTVDERGDLHLDANNDNVFDLGKLADWDPRLGHLAGTVHVWLTADGPIRSPKIEASLTAEHLIGPTGVETLKSEEDKLLRFNLYKIIIDPSRKDAEVQVAGEYFYKGFQGIVSGNAPFGEYPFTIPTHQGPSCRNHPGKERLEGHCTTARRIGSGSLERNSSKAR